MSTRKVKKSSPPSEENVPPDFSLNLIDEDLVRAENEDKLTVYLLFLISTAAISGFLFGYDTGVVGVALPLVGTDLGNELSYSQEEIITAGTTIGAIFGAIVLGSLADRLGRRWTIFISDCFFTIGAVVIASSYSIGQIVAGRVVLGLGLGGASAVGPLYITEIAPTAVRGRCIGTNALCVCIGQVVSAAVGAGCQNMKNGWRFLFALGVVPSMLQLILMHWLPESPRVLILRDRNEDAKAVLRKIYRDAPESQIDFKFRVIEEVVSATTKLETDLTFTQRVKKLFVTGPYRRSIIVVCGMQAFSQLTGFNSLLYYAGNLFGLLGLSNPALGALIPSGVNAVFVLVGMMLVDKVGRRRLLLIFVPVMAAGLAWCIAAFWFMCRPTGGLLEEDYTYPTQHVAVVIVGIVLFTFGYGISISHLSWYQSEFLALEVRAAGSSLATASNWLGNLVVSVSYLSELENLTPSGTYGLYLGFITVGYVFVMFCYPESKGLSIDEIARVFHDGFGVKKSVQMRREKQRLIAEWAKEGEAGKIHDTAQKAKETAHLEFTDRPTRGFRTDLEN
ncbi:hypothetical protein V866_001200 [Kwoniella sp. B9012]